MNSMVMRDITESKKRKDVGKRLHRKKTAKDDFLDDELRSRKKRLNKTL